MVSKEWSYNTFGIFVLFVVKKINICVPFKIKPIVFISFSALLAFFLSLLWLNTGYSDAFRTDLKQSILNELIYINPPPPGTKVDVIYVLGGNQRSLLFGADLL